MKLHLPLWIVVLCVIALAGVCALAIQASRKPARPDAVISLSVYESSAQWTTARVGHDGKITVEISCPEFPDSFLNPERGTKLEAALNGLPREAQLLPPSVSPGQIKIGKDTEVWSGFCPGPTVNHWVRVIDAKYVEKRWSPDDPWVYVGDIPQPPA